MVEAQPETLHSSLHDCFRDEQVFMEVIDALLRVTGATSENDRRKAAHKAEGYFIEEGRLWRIGGYTPSQAMTCCECITKSEATQLARVEHEKLHMHREGGFSKIGLYADVFSQKLWALKSKTTMGKDTVNGLKHISQAFIAPTTFMADGGPHFNCRIFTMDQWTPGVEQQHPAEHPETTVCTQMRRQI